MKNIIFIVEAEKIRKQWCVYYLRNVQTAALEFIGCCPLHQIVLMPDVSRNPLFKFDQPYICEVTEIYDTKLLAQRGQSTRLRDNGYMPPMNKYSKFESRGKIQCEETGEQFDTLQQCGHAHSIDPGALGKHLNRKAGFKSVKGRHYFYTGAK